MACCLLVYMKYWPIAIARCETLHFHPRAWFYKLSNLVTSNFLLSSTSLQQGRNDKLVIVVNPKLWARQIDDNLMQKPRTIKSEDEVIVVSNLNLEHNEQTKIT